jgi:hypothetical protein
LINKASCLQGELAGNGLLTRREFDPYSGHLNRMTTGIEGSSTNPLIRDLNYTLYLDTCSG